MNLHRHLRAYWAILKVVMGFRRQRLAKAHMAFLFNSSSYASSYSYTILISFCMASYLMHSFLETTLSAAILATAHMACSTIIRYFESRRDTTIGITPLSTKLWQYWDSSEAMLVIHHRASSWKCAHVVCDAISSILIANPKSSTSWMFPFVPFANIFLTPIKPYKTCCGSFCFIKLARCGNISDVYSFLLNSTYSALNGHPSNYWYFFFRWYCSIDGCFADLDLLISSYLFLRRISVWYSCTFYSYS